MRDIKEMDRDELFSEAVAAAKRAAEGKARREELQGPSAEEKARRARQDQRAAEWQEAMSVAIERAYANVKETIFPSEEAFKAISRALRLLAALDPDHATEMNGQGFSRCDSYFGRYLAGQRDLFGPEAVVGKALVRRYRRQLSAELVAAALEEPVEMRDIEDDEDQGDMLRPIVTGAADVMKLEPVAEVPEVPAFDQAAHEAAKAKFFTDRAPSAAARAAICEALAVIAAAGSPTWARAAKEYLVTAAEWSDAKALLARYVVSRNREGLDTVLAATALGEPVSVVEQAPPQPAPKKPGKQMTLAWNLRAGRWELKAHTSDQCAQAAAAGLTYDPIAKKYTGAGCDAHAFRQCITTPDDAKRMTEYMNIYWSATTGEIARRAAKYVKQSAPVAADPKTLAPAKRGRGRPSNAELGRDAALSQVERNRRYRARKAAAAVTVPRALADRLAAARSARGQTTDALLTQALDALGA